MLSKRRIERLGIIPGTEKRRRSQEMGSSCSARHKRFRCGAELLEPRTLLTTFSNPSGFPIIDATTAQPMSSINVSGMAGNTSNVTVTLNGLFHNRPDDIDLMLFSPSGQSVFLMSDVGGLIPVFNATVTLSDAGLTTIPNNGPLASGTYKPTNVGTDEFDFPPATGAAMAAFNGTSPNGAWYLLVADDATPEGGVITGGWSLNITTGGPDTTPPTVTSVSPSPGSTISSTSMYISVTFSEPVTGVDTTDLVLAGPAAINAAFTGPPLNSQGNTWDFGVSGISAGTLNVDLAPDANDIEDFAGNDLPYYAWSYTSWAVVMRVTSATYQFETVGPAVRFALSAPAYPASIAASDLDLHTVLPNGSLGSAVAATGNSYDAGTQAIRFSVPPTDGNYHARLPAGSISDSYFTPLASQSVVTFFILGADATRDRIVDTQDFNVLAANFGGSGKVFSEGNFDYDGPGVINSLDFDILAAQYGKTLPAPVSPAGVATVATASPFGNFAIRDRVDTAGDPLGDPVNESIVWWN